MTERTAMVLAAGRGARMRPLSAMTPKPLIEVAGKALIDYLFDRLESGGVTRFVVNVHYLPDLIEVHVKKRAPGRVEISDERDGLLETGGGIVKALPLLPDEPFLVANSDTFWVEGASNDVARLIAAYDQTVMDGLLLLSPTVSAVGYDGNGDFDLSGDGRLTRRAEKTIAPFVYAGCGLFSRRAFEGMPPGPFSLNVVFDRLLAKGRLFGLRLDGLWLHVGTPAAISEAERAIYSSAA
ncbi:MAG: nucleotidyltransferase family protein [Pseudomonadota bacterium]